MDYYLAIDIGASSGRHMISWYENGKMYLQEVYRFKNGVSNNNGELCWDVEKLFNEIKNGLRKCVEINCIPKSIGIDTWGVDFVLLDKHNVIIGNSVSYRDHRTDDCTDEVYKIISEQMLYEHTGIQKQQFNTIFQLFAIQKKHPEYLTQAEHFVMIPDYFNYLLTGCFAQEYTNATTTGLVNAGSRNWDYEIIDKLGYPKKIFRQLLLPRTLLGNLRPEVAAELGFQTKVVLVASHDTGSAFVAIPSTERNTLVISSGTWSLLGAERKFQDCSEKAHSFNFTNEGGYDFKYRFLKNIMGLWMIQNVKKELNESFSIGFSYDDLCHLAQASSVDSIVDCNDQQFLSPISMKQAISEYCATTNQQVPQTPGDIACVVYNSLAVCYKKTIDELQQLLGEQYTCLHVIGGGSREEYLNTITARMIGKPVYAGPVEATAIGNCVVQMIQDHIFDSTIQARDCIARSFEIRRYAC